MCTTSTTSKPGALSRALSRVSSPPTNDSTAPWPSWASGAHRPMALNPGGNGRAKEAVCPCQFWQKSGQINSRPYWEAQGGVWGVDGRWGSRWPSSIELPLWWTGAKGQCSSTIRRERNRRLMTIGYDIATTHRDTCPSQPNRQVGQRQGSGCSAYMGPVAGGSHEASKPGQKGFERRVLAASELRCPGVQPWQDGAGAHEGKNPDRGDPSVVENGVHSEGRNSDVKMAKGREPREARLAGRAGWRLGAGQHSAARELWGVGTGSV